MWNYLKGLLTNGFLVKRVLVALAVSGGIIAIVSNSDIDKGSAFFLTFWILVLLWTAFGVTIKNKLKNHCTVPYWSDKFGLEQCIILLDQEEFKPYVTKNGDIIRDFKVSDSGRWFCISGMYYPSYLVFDYDASASIITMIDGAQIDAGDWKYEPQIVSALYEYLSSDRTFRIDHAYHVRINTEDCERAFKRCFEGSYDELATADWDKIRYLWERELSGLEVTALNRTNLKNHVKAIQNADTAKEAILTRVVMDSEIQLIAKAILNGSIKDISDWFKLESYKDDMCVCNGVKLLKEIGYPASKPGTQFLFDCLRDIQKPYFEDAVIALERYPYDELTAIIESHVETAHNTGDVLWGAGLIYLSKRIGYRISLEEDEDEIKKIFRDELQPAVRSRSGS